MMLACVLTVFALGACDSEDLSNRTETQTVAAEGDYSPQTFLIELLEWIGDYEISFKHRAGHYEKPSEVHTTGVFVDR